MLKLCKNSNVAEQKKLIQSVRRTLLPAPPLIVQWLEKALFLLPSKFVPVILKPESQIKVINSETGDFNAVADSPYFQIMTDAPDQFPGWYYFEMSLVRHGGNRIATLYVDAGRGYCKEDSVFVPSNRRGSICEVVFLPYGIKDLRWSPMETKGRFTQSPIIVHRITTIEAYLRRGWRAAADLWGMRRSPLVQRAGVSWRTLVCDLNAAYTWSANLRRANSATVGYSGFIQQNDTLRPSDVSEIFSHLEKLPLTPVFSIVMPVFNPPVEFFIVALNSIIEQFYPHWELCIADDASTDPRVREIIESYMAKDSRIKAIFRNQNGHISAASNSALTLVSGEFVVLMDQDDVLPAHALYHVAVEVNRHPDAQMIYSDDDKIDEFNNRTDPYFKSDWNPDLFYSHNMFSHLGVYRSELIRAVGGFRLGYEGSQDYDLALRCVEKIQINQIHHIPRVLYHWRIHADSTSTNASVKPYAMDAGGRALNDHFRRIGIAAEVDTLKFGYRVRYPLPPIQPLVTLIIPTRDQVDILKQCITSIISKTTYLNYEILVVDNQSSEKSALNYLATLSRDPRIKVIKYEAPFNYSAINNFAVTMANGEIIGLINNDIEVISSDWLSEMVSHATRPDVGAVGAKLLYSDDTIQHAGVVLGLSGMACHAHKFFKSTDWGYFGRASLIQTYSAVTAACLVVRKETYIEVGGFDEKNLTVAFNDVDFCLKLAKAGYRNIYTPYAELYHHESISRGQENSPEKQARFLSEVAFMRQQWSHVIERDPYYNPNLTLISEDFSFANNIVNSPHHGYPLNVDSVDN